MLSRTLRRYAALLRTQVGISLTMAVQYRFDFLVKGGLALFWLGLALVPLLVVFSQRASVAGWTLPEALVVLGWFSLLKAILEGGVSPSLNAVSEGIRTGALDFVLLKPADAQFLVSTARFEPWRLLDVGGAIATLVFAFVRLGRPPSVGSLLAAGALLLVAVVLLYSIWILVVSASFWVVKVDNLSYLFQSLFDVGRWPIDVFRGSLFKEGLRFVFTVIFPVALMTSYPAKALLGKLDASVTAAVLAGGLAFAAVARFTWKRAIRFYTSASS